MMMAQQLPLAAQKNKGKLLLKLASCHEEIEAALRLRFAVSNVEMGEGLSSSFHTGMDKDPYDSYCDHLIISDPEQERVVGTYRLLPSFRAEGGIGYYAESEFDISALKCLSGNKLELGRACVHPAYRSSQALNLMWFGIREYMIQHKIRYVFGRAVSIPPCLPS